ncbi:DMT family transporter [Pseudodonghicola flavimaris]|uniref:DMT family transporter n=1 Tax=Pseudodonghicola flavimaris TaxID=3050036 RepID=A0ABT7F4R4_9RHOB|nr:DMT family transporter [Pseudodonghicola flavimaris]MDK3019603.1 DMT family transporter [Pseudodonghicola flavimaris]
MVHHPALQGLAPSTLRLWLAVLGVGLCWGATGPLSKLAVSTGHGAIGISFWNTLLAALVTTSIQVLRRRRLPLSPRHIRFFLVCGLLGTALPSSLSYTAYAHLPVGVTVMLLSAIPMVTLLLAWPLGLEAPSAGRVLGLGLGAAGVALIVLPGSSLPDPSQAIWILAPLAVAISYSGENIVIAKSEIRDLGPLSTLCGLSWGALALLTPVMLVTGAGFDLTVFGPPELAVLGITALNMVAYAGYIWLIGRAGPVFAAQVGYAMTGTGVLLGMAFFGERHSVWVWAALAVIVLGLTLVQPRQPKAVAVTTPAPVPQGPAKM